MKNKSPYDTPELDLLAREALSAMLQGVYSNPQMLTMMADVAKENKNTFVQELAERAYWTAIAMIKRKAKVLNDVKE